MWDITYQPRGFQGHGGQHWGYSSAMYMVEEEGGAYLYVLSMNTSTVESMDDQWAFPNPSRRKIVAIENHPYARLC